MAKIMVVDDSLFVRSHLVKMAGKNGYETMAARDGEEAVRLYRQAHPDVVLMDITMPRKDGLQALTEIRQFDPGAKVIMLTALNQKPVMTQAIRSGAKDFLIKPVSPTQLLVALQKVLA